MVKRPIFYQVQIKVFIHLSKYGFACVNVYFTRFKSSDLQYVNVFKAISKFYVIICIPD